MLTSRVALNRFSVAALITLIVTIIDGPIIQKASQVVVKTRDPTSSLVSATVLDGYLPSNFSGYGGTGTVPDLFTPLFSNVSLAYQNRDAIQVPISACSSPNTTCTLDFPGLGWDVSCNETLKPYDFGTLGSANITNNNLTTSSMSTTYGSTSNLLPEVFMSLHLTTTYKPDSACAGNFVKRVLRNIYEASAQLRLAVMTFVPYLVEATGSSASNYLTSDVSTYGNCTMTWSDPTDDYINSARELMLRSVLAYADATPQNTSTKLLSARITTIATSYETDDTYLYATIAVMGLLMLIVLFLLSGFHRLGRAVSLDAFEIARALGAPLLQGGSTNSDTNTNTSIKPIRDLHLKYGEVHGGKPNASAAQGGTAMVSAVSNGTYALVGTDNQRMGRLGLVEAHRAAEIQKDVLY